MYTYLHHLSIDLETYSSINIKKAGAQAYIRSPDFEILLLSYSVDGGPVKTIDLTETREIPQNITDMIFNPAYVKHAFNAAFEWGCLSRYYNTELEPRQWHDTMLHGLYCGYTAGLFSTFAFLASQQRLTVREHEIFRVMIPISGSSLKSITRRTL